MDALLRNMFPIYQPEYTYCKYLVDAEQTSLDKTVLLSIQEIMLKLMGKKIHKHCVRNLDLSLYQVCCQIMYCEYSLRGVEIPKFSTCPRTSKLQKSTCPSLNLTCPNFMANHLLLVHLTLKALRKNASEK